MTQTTTARKNAPAVGAWVFDPAHSDLRITARHLMVTKVTGTFADMTGTIEVAEEPTDSKVEVTAKAASVTTGVEDRDNHLRSEDFLDVENYPEVKFVSTEITPDGDEWKLTGDLTIRGTTKPVTFDLRYLGSANDPWGNEKAALVATSTIERAEWGLTWNAQLEGGGVLVSKKFDVEFQVQASRKS